MKFLFSCVFSLILLVFSEAFSHVGRMDGDGGHKKESTGEYHIHSHWRGVRIAPEHRCAPYERRTYRYSPAMEDSLVAIIGGLYSPYDGQVFDSKKDTHIEHIVATTEAHDSGMCARSDSVKKVFAADLLNLTLAGAGLNISKSGKDATDWVPEKNRCWFAYRVVAVRQKYDLTIDRMEAAVLEDILSRCGTTEIVR